MFQFRGCIRLIDLIILPVHSLESIWRKMRNDGVVQRTCAKIRSKVAVQIIGLDQQTSFVIDLIKKRRIDIISFGMNLIPETVFTFVSAIHAIRNFFRPWLPALIETSPPKSNFGFFVTILMMPPGATLPYKIAALPLRISTRSNELISGITEALTLAPSLYMLSSDIR